MACENQVGVRNILLTFYDCDSGAKIGPISHDLADDTQPEYNLCPYANEPLPGGYVSRTKGNNMIGVSVIRNSGIPLAMYQGCASMDISIEHFNGRLVTGLGGTPTGSDPSDGHSVALSVVFQEVDELLPEPLEAA